VPDDATTGVKREWLLIRLRTPWVVGSAAGAAGAAGPSVEHAAGALLAARLDDFLAGDRTFTVLFEPDDHTPAW
jgi:prolyl oligopeptidase